MPCMHTRGSLAANPELETRGAHEGHTSGVCTLRAIVGGGPRGPRQRVVPQQQTRFAQFRRNPSLERCREDVPRLRADCPSRVLTLGCPRGLPGQARQRDDRRHPPRLLCHLEVRVEVAQPGDHREGRLRLARGLGSPHLGIGGSIRPQPWLRRVLAVVPRATSALFVVAAHEPRRGPVRSGSGPWPPADAALPCRACVGRGGAPGAGRARHPGCAGSHWRWAGVWRECGARGGRCVSVAAPSDVALELQVVSDLLRGWGERLATQAVGLAQGCRGCSGRHPRSNLARPRGGSRGLAAWRDHLRTRCHG